MHVNGKPYRTIWLEADGCTVALIDQTQLPHHFILRHLHRATDAFHAIQDMWVRGAPLIGATAAYGILLGMLEDPSDAGLEAVCTHLAQARPTAVNLHWAIERMRSILKECSPPERAAAARQEAAALCDEDIEVNKALGRHGLTVIAEQYRRVQRPVNILTHCNAGWLATVDYGTALAPIFQAHAAGIPLHIWVDETRPRNQGAQLTAWELVQAGIAHRLLADNSGGHLMQQGRVDLCLVGTDRTAVNGDVCNKIGTYLKALAATDNGVPFYVALPSSTIDWNLKEGRAIPIEERSEDEVLYLSGLNDQGKVERVRLAPEQSQAANPAFDVTPARLVTGLITERGICAASEEGLRGLFPNRFF
jgi:methylthioribose-1-phosphate isomerase